MQKHEVKKLHKAKPCSRSIAAVCFSLPVCQLESHVQHHILVNCSQAHVLI